MENINQDDENNNQENQEIQEENQEIQEEEIHEEEIQEENQEIQEENQEIHEEEIHEEEIQEEENQVHDPHAANNELHKRLRIQLNKLETEPDEEDTVLRGFFSLGCKSFLKGYELDTLVSDAEETCLDVTFYTRNLKSNISRALAKDETQLSQAEREPLRSMYEDAISAENLVRRLQRARECASTHALEAKSRGLKLISAVKDDDFRMGLIHKSAIKSKVNLMRRSKNSLKKRKRRALAALDDLKKKRHDLRDIIFVIYAN